MTVLIAVNTRDAIVMAADSQGTITRPVINPDDLSKFFDMENGRRMKLDPTGRPALDTWSRMASYTMEIPYKTQYEVEKIFHLDPLKMGVMATGISSVGDRTIRSLIREFKNSCAFVELSLKQYTLEQTAFRLLDFLWPKYIEQYVSDTKPELELILCGYDKERFTPGVVRINVNTKTVTEPDYDFCIFFGGITREIQRLLFGIDAVTKTRLMRRSQELLEAYHNRLESHLKNQGVEVALPRPKDLGSDFGLFNNFQMDVLRMNCATYSERDAIECADFLVNVMIKAQRFSDQFPSTGGATRIAIIDKYSGFHFVSQRYLRE